MKSIIVKERIEGLKEQTNEYSVNDNCKGLWLNGKQIAGHADFSASTPQELIRKLRKDTDPVVEKISMVRGSANGWD